MRAILNDTTIEAAQDVLKDSPEGLLCHHDELSGWFGAMDKYSAGNRGAAKNRAFWLQAFNGGPYGVNRIGRGVIHIPNLSVSILGGVQPDVIRRVAGEALDDGLIQRLCPIVLRQAAEGKDERQSLAVNDYHHTVEMLRTLQKQVVELDRTAQKLRRELERKHLRFVCCCEGFNKKLAAHIGKYDGIFARLCLIWHCVEKFRPRSLPHGH